MRKYGRIKYDQVHDGDWLTVPKLWFMGCCDCGLIHAMKFRYKPIKKGDKTKVLQVQVCRDNRRTAQIRRHKGVKVVAVKKKKS